MQITTTFKLIDSVPPPQQGKGSLLTLFTGHTQIAPYVGILNGKNIIALGLVGPRFSEREVRVDLCNRPAWRQATFQEAKADLKDIEALELWGTPFQTKIWKTLYHLPRHQKVSYKEVAHQAGYSSAFQAVGQAIARNPISLFIPCHLVVRNSGEIGDYYWGKPLKETLLQTLANPLYNSKLYDVPR